MRPILFLCLILVALGVSACHDEETRSENCTRNGQQVQC